MTKRESFVQLAGLARYIMEHASEDFADALVAIYESLNVPVLRFYSRYTHEERRRALSPSIRQMLTLISRNETALFIEQAIEDWRNDELPVIKTSQVSSEDITFHNYAKGRALRMFIPRYTSDPDLRAALVEEIERFTVILDSKLFTAYLEVRNKELSDLNEALRNREQQLVEAQEVGHVGSYEWDFSKRQLNVTPYVQTILEGDPPRTLDAFLRLVHADDREKLRNAVETAVHTGSDFVYEFRYLGPVTEKVLLSRGRVETKEGVPHRMIGTVIDVTERIRLINQLKANQNELEVRERYLKELNMSLQFANRELRRTNEELESFNFIASHDLQEPLRKIQVYSNRILENDIKELPLSLRDHFEKIMRASGRMQKLIEDFLVFSHTLKTSYPAGRVNLNDIVSEILRELHADIDERGAVIEVGDLPTVYAVSFQIKQLMVNLISNALKYTRPDTPPRIQIASTTVKGTDSHHELANPTAEYYCVSVVDNGIGFEPKYKQRIFELFQRLHNRESYSGTGIGLALCKKIIQNLGGFIDVDSTPGQGSVFRVYIPAHTDSPSMGKVDPIQRTQQPG